MAHLQGAREKMSSGRYQEAFQQVVDLEVQDLPSLLKKIACLVDIGFILRDEKILRYGLYLLEKHGSEVLEVEDLAPDYFLNLANQYANMVTLSSYNDEYFGYYDRKELLRARELYERALSYDGLSADLSCRIRLGLARVLTVAGRGVEALEHYEKVLKAQPEHREALQEKVRLMTEYARINNGNRRELLREAWKLSLVSQELASEGGDDPPEPELRRRILEELEDRAFLDGEEEYPRYSIITESEEEHQYTMFSLRHNLYLNLCGFCRKCDFAVGDQVRLNSSSLVIRQNQKKRYATLAASYSRLSELYRTGRFLLADALRQGDSRGYASPGMEETGLAGYAPGSMEFYLLRNAFLHGWSLWDAVKEYLAIYWDFREDAADLFAFFHERDRVRSLWLEKRSPSLHGIFDLYMDCLRGGRRVLFSTAEAFGRLPEGRFPLSTEELRERTIELYKVFRVVLLSLGIMHERNELQRGSWYFPRPLYNFYLSHGDWRQN